MLIISQRPDVLRANGRDPTLIICLLEDANTWITLRRLLHNQVEAVKTFRVDYIKYGYEHQIIEQVAQTIEHFAQVVNLRIDKLDSISTALIQLEFNLTSIREAQKSTTLNRSMKRLTWVTFIFLPLTFVSGLFGMNVDVLKANPPWWWYIVFAVVTLGLTITVWVIFKSYRNVRGLYLN
jgi:Mg2+ and Co2+ transporter CorA